MAQTLLEIRALMQAGTLSLGKGSLPRPIRGLVGLVMVPRLLWVGLLRGAEARRSAVHRWHAPGPNKHVSSLLFGLFLKALGHNFMQFWDPSAMWGLS